MASDDFRVVWGGGGGAKGGGGGAHRSRKRTVRARPHCPCAPPHVRWLHTARPRGSGAGDRVVGRGGASMTAGVQCDGCGRSRLFGRGQGCVSRPALTGSHSVAPKTVKCGGPSHTNAGRRGEGVPHHQKTAHLRGAARPWACGGVVPPVSQVGQGGGGGDLWCLRPGADEGRGLWDPAAGPVQTAPGGSPQRST